MAKPKSKSPSTRGRKPDAGSKSGQIRELLKTGMSAGDIAKQIGCTTALVYNVKAKVGGGGPKRGRGRPPKVSAGTTGSGFAGLDGILAAVKGAEQQRAQLRAALERIQGIVADALG